MCSHVREAWHQAVLPCSRDFVFVFVFLLFTPKQIFCVNVSFERHKIIILSGRVWGIIRVRNVIKKKIILFWTSVIRASIVNFVLSYSEFIESVFCLPNIMLCCWPGPSASPSRFTVSLFINFSFFAALHSVCFTPSFFQCAFFHTLV